MVDGRRRTRMERNDITIFSNGNSVKNWDSDAWFDCGLLMLACVYWLVQIFMIKASGGRNGSKYLAIDVSSLILFLFPLS